jgi:hypothetical protein
MGGSSSKPAVMDTPLPQLKSLGIENATFSGADVARIKAENDAAAAAYQTALDTAKAAADAAGKTAMWWRNVLFGSGILLGLLVLALSIVLIHDTIARNTNGLTWMLPNVGQFTNLKEGMDNPDATTAAPTKNVPPPLLWQWAFGTGSLSGPHDATTPTYVAGSSAPLSAGNQGGYGIQWWMYVKDWNYGYGQEKMVLSRPDTTDASIMNPKVTLHPTDNVLRVSVSVFPSGDAGTSVTEPAPANAAGSTDDVFVCEVPNIPLQKWFSVSLTVFERNVDIYIDGKLVKSCFLSGVPKPAVGDIQIAGNGGFSGLVCDLSTYPKMLTPTDAATFYAGSTSCRSATDANTPLTSTTGYSVKFGVYDTVGKQIQQYTF